MAVMIGIDPHKRSHTAVAHNGSEQVLGQLCVTADRGQVPRLLAFATPWPDRVWAVENANGLGRLLSRQLLAAGETVVDVPATLSARVRALSGAGHKTDAHDALSTAVAGRHGTGVKQTTPPCGSISTFEPCSGGMSLAFVARRPRRRCSYIQSRQSSEQYRLLACTAVSISTLHVGPRRTPGGAHRRRARSGLSHQQRNAVGGRPGGMKQPQYVHRRGSCECAARVRVIVPASIVRGWIEPADRVAAARAQGQQAN